MTDTVKILAGDWVVVWRRWGYDLYQVTRATEKCHWREPEWSGRKGRERRTDSDNVIFAGPEGIAKKLHEKLVSSLSLQEHESQQSGERRKKRDDGLLAKANAEKDQVPMAAV